MPFLGMTPGVERKTPKVPNFGREDHTRVHRDLKPVAPFLCLHLCVGLPHRAFCEVSCVFKPALCSGEGMVCGAITHFTFLEFFYSVILQGRAGTD